MNNILYIVQNVKNLELRNLLGDRWIRTHRGQIRQWHTSYLRSAWGKALMCLKVEGSLWRVPDAQLREEHRIFISEKVLPAYRSFFRKFGSQLESGRHVGKYVKYTPDDLEHYLSDLFEGKPTILNNVKRKGTYCGIMQDLTS
ncbi:putative exocyst complex component Exo70, cullin repeat-like-containing domain superfamily [Helianthus anomalus]